MKQLLQQVASCTICVQHLPHGVRPVVRASQHCRILIIGQAPGRKVHETGIPWNDPSGVQLRQWLGVNEDQFYDDRLFALMPMGFCYPGTGKSGDLPPRPECAPQWHPALLDQMPAVQLTLLIGMYAQRHYLTDAHRTLTENVRNHAKYAPSFLPLPHPSPRNRRWQSNNPWFADEVVPYLRTQVQRLISTDA